MAILQTQDKVFLELIIAVDKLKDLLITIHPKSFEEDKNRN